jgi:hypothetical protein
MSALTVALTVLTVARVTRLLTADRILDRPRIWIMERFGPDSMTAYFVTCPWCMSMYVGAAGAGAWWAWGETMGYQAVTLALAASYVSGWLATREGD